MPEDARGPLAFGRGATGVRPLVIGLVNNMPDAAVAATEAQFRALIARAAGPHPVQLKLFSLPGVPRSAAAQTAMAKCYISTDSLPAAPVNALIVTGAEPVAADLKDEPFWNALAALTDWAARNTVSTIFSCLAAHAAVLHLDGIRRTPLPEKCSGVFPMRAAPHALTKDQSGMLVPHSRWNALDQGALTRRGYQVLSASDAIGVDAFMLEQGGLREQDSLLLFLQGHPEYDADSLMLEYRRDVRRFVLGERATHPTVPTGYFDADVEQALMSLAAETARAPAITALSACAALMRAHPPTARWAGTTDRLYSNWLDLVAARVNAPTPV